jgi:hypothetical protein
MTTCAHGQGGQLGRIFAPLGDCLFVCLCGTQVNRQAESWQRLLFINRGVIVYTLGIFFEHYRGSEHFYLLRLSLCINLSNKWVWATFWAIFFINSSGHPAHGWSLPSILNLANFLRVQSPSETEQRHEWTTKRSWQNFHRRFFARWNKLGLDRACT